MLLTVGTAITPLTKRNDGRGVIQVTTAASGKGVDIQVSIDGVKWGTAESIASTGSEVTTVKELVLTPYLKYSETGSGGAAVVHFDDTV